MKPKNSSSRIENIRTIMALVFVIAMFISLITGPGWLVWPCVAGIIISIGLKQSLSLYSPAYVFSAVISFVILKLIGVNGIIGLLAVLTAAFWADHRWRKSRPVDDAA